MPDTCPRCHRPCADLHTLIYLDGATYVCATCLPALVRASGRLLDIFIPTPMPAPAVRLVVS